jgi:drug/metabolite transporter (DMT)-like permease
MPVTVFALVLFGAACHATWNAIVKGGEDKLLTAILVASSATLAALVLLPFLPQPAPSSWPFLVASMLLQLVYYVLIARTYHATEMSQSYPLMRGTAPLLVALASVALLGEHLSAETLAGVTVICLGILSMAFGGRRDGGMRDLALPLVNAVVIAAYTLVDGAGVQRSGAPAAYTLWLSLLTGVPLAAWAVTTRPAAFAAYARRHWRLGSLGGIGTLLSYGLALWAMTIAPVAMVAALRETSILFGTAIAGLFLKERVKPARLASVFIIALGAIMLRLA